MSKDEDFWKRFAQFLSTLDEEEISTLYNALNECDLYVQVDAVLQDELERRQHVSTK